MNFLLLNFLLIVIVIFLLIILSFVWPPDSPWAPWWRTGKDIADNACKLGKVCEEDIVYELGCGEGLMLMISAKKYKAKAVGIEIDPLRTFIARIYVYFYRLTSKVKIIRGNFFDYDLSEATVIYCYLVPKALKRLKPKFLKELKPGTRIISYRYKIDFPLVKKDTKNNIYLYKIPQ